MIAGHRRPSGGSAIRPKNRVNTTWGRGGVLCRQTGSFYLTLLPPAQRELSISCIPSGEFGPRMPVRRHVAPMLDAPASGKSSINLEGLRHQASSFRGEKDGGSYTHTEWCPLIGLTATGRGCVLQICRLHPDTAQPPTTCEKIWCAFGSPPHTRVLFTVHGIQVCGVNSTPPKRRRLRRITHHSPYFGLD